VVAIILLDRGAVDFQGQLLNLLPQFEHIETEL
jgi:hypothetical protein